MLEHAQEVAVAEMPLVVSKPPLSDEVLASLAAVQRAQEAARARIRRQTVRTRAWFGAVVGGVGLAVILLGPRVGRQLAASPSRAANASPSRIASASKVDAPTPPAARQAAKPEVPAAAALVAAPPEGLGAAPTLAPVESPMVPEAPIASTARAGAAAADDAGGCRVTAGQARWHVDVDACAKLFENRPTDAALALTIAHGHHARGHIAQSGEWARRAIALDARSAEAFVILARAEARAGRPDASTQAYRKYLELVPRGWHASEARAAVRRSAASSEAPGG